MKRRFDNEKYVIKVSTINGNTSDIFCGCYTGSIESVKDFVRTSIIKMIDDYRAQWGEDAEVDSVWDQMAEYIFEVKKAEPEDRHADFPPCFPPSSHL